METFKKLRHRIVYEWLSCENANELFRVTTFFTAIFAGFASVLAMLTWVIIQIGFAWFVAIPVIYYLICHAIMWPEDSTETECGRDNEMLIDEDDLDDNFKL